MFIRVPLPWGFHYWYCPRGPIGSQILPSLGGVFVRFEPSVKPPKDSRIIKTVSIQPSDTLILDVSGSEEALLAGMHPKTRYNIMVGERKGVRIQRERAIRLGDELWDILEATADRGGFHLHPRTYYHALLSLCDLWVARKDHLPLAVALTIDFAGTRTYLHGGSTTAHRDLMAPSTLHWAIIKDAKAQGLAWYDWWGIEPEGAKNDPLAGVTRFKLGFGGERVSYPGTFDYLLKPMIYRAYTFARRFTRP